MWFGQSERGAREEGFKENEEVQLHPVSLPISNADKSLARGGHFPFFLCPAWDAWDAPSSALLSLSPLFLIFQGSLQSKQTSKMKPKKTNRVQRYSGGQGWSGASTKTGQKGVNRL